MPLIIYNVAYVSPKVYCGILLQSSHVISLVRFQNECRSRNGLRVSPSASCQMSSRNFRKSFLCRNSVENTKNSSEFDIEFEIFEFMENSENPNVFPTKRQLLEAGRRDLVQAIETEGGWLTMGWEKDPEPTDNRNSGDAKNYRLNVAQDQPLASSKMPVKENLEEKPKTLMQQLISYNPYAEMKKVQESQQLTDEQRTPGLEGNEKGVPLSTESTEQNISESLKVEDSETSEEASSSEEYFSESDGGSTTEESFSSSKTSGENLRKKNLKGLDEGLGEELRRISAENGGANGELRMPSYKELRQRKRGDLEKEIKRRGGWKVVAQLFGLASTAVQGTPREGRQHKFTTRVPPRPRSDLPGGISSGVSDAPAVQGEDLSGSQDQEGAQRSSRFSGRPFGWEGRELYDFQNNRKKFGGKGRGKESDSQTPNQNSPAGQNLSKWRWKRRIPGNSTTPKSASSAPPQQFEKSSSLPDPPSQSPVQSEAAKLAPGSSPPSEMPGGTPPLAPAPSFMERIKALEKSLVSQKEALHMSRSSLLSQAILEAGQERKQVREETVQGLVDIAESLEFRENDILKTRRDIRRTRAEVVAMEGKLASEFSKAKKVFEDQMQSQRVDSNQTAELRATKVVWPNHGSEVLLTGSFDNWKNKIRMERSNAGVFVAKLQLLPGRYEIKFIVDGMWKVDPHRSIVYSGNIENNLLIVF